MYGAIPHTPGRLAEWNSEVEMREVEVSFEDSLFRGMQLGVVERVTSHKRV